MTKQILIILVVLGLVAGGGFFLIASSKKTESPKSNEKVENLTTKPEKIINYLKWEDQAGFGFQYPEGVSINNHPEDNDNYANLTISDKNGGGEINIVMADTKLKTLEMPNAIETDLGGIKGKKEILAGGEVVIKVIDNGVIVTLQKEAKAGELIETAWEKLIDSWQFVYPTTAVTTGKTQDSGSNEDVLEEE